MKGKHSHKHKTITVHTYKNSNNLNDNLLQRTLSQSSSRGPRIPAGGTILLCAMAIVLVVVGVMRLLDVFQFTSGQPDPQSVPVANSMSQASGLGESSDSQESITVGGDIDVPDSGVSEEGSSSADTTTSTPAPTAEPPADSPEYVFKYPEMYVEPPTHDEPNYDDKVVYLTFDDGPCTTTPKLLDKLDELGVKATFFVTGLYASREDIIETLKDIKNRGHEIGVHTFSHDYKKIYASVDAFLEDYKLVDDMILEATGERSKIYRFAGGSNTGYNANIRADLITEMNRRGFVHYDWNASNGDSDGLGAQGEINQALSNCRSQNRSILLMHDAPGKAQVVDSLDSIIPTLQAEGYRFEVLDDTVKPIQFVKVEPVG